VGSLRTVPHKSACEGHADRAGHDVEMAFVRDDLPRAETCFQIALALREEVAGLETAGLRVI
jgi:hypothetical protein